MKESEQQKLLRRLDAHYFTALDALLGKGWRKSRGRKFILMWWRNSQRKFVSKLLAKLPDESYPEAYAKIDEGLKFLKNAARQATRSLPRSPRGNRDLLTDDQRADVCRRMSKRIGENAQRVSAAAYFVAGELKLKPRYVQQIWERRGEFLGKSFRNPDV